MPLKYQTQDFFYGDISPTMTWYCTPAIGVDIHRASLMSNKLRTVMSFVKTRTQNCLNVLVTGLLSSTRILQ